MMSKTETVVLILVSKVIDEPRSFQYYEIENYYRRNGLWRYYKYSNSTIERTLRKLASMGYFERYYKMVYDPESECYKKKVYYYPTQKFFEFVKKLNGEKNDILA